MVEGREGRVGKKKKLWLPVKPKRINPRRRVEFDDGTCSKEERIGGRGGGLLMVGREREGGGGEGRGRGAEKEVEGVRGL